MKTFKQFVDILEMSDFAAGGGNAKMKQSGMSRAEVEALGKKNLSKLSSSTTQSSRSAVGSTSSDAVVDRLDDIRAYRSKLIDAMAQGTNLVGLRKKELAQEREKAYNEYRKKQDQDHYYKIKTFKDIPGTFKGK